MLALTINFFLQLLFLALSSLVYLTHAQLPPDNISIQELLKEATVIEFEEQPTILPLVPVEVAASAPDVQPTPPEPVVPLSQRFRLRNRNRPAFRPRPALRDNLLNQDVEEEEEVKAPVPKPTRPSRPSRPSSRLNSRPNLRSRFRPRPVSRVVEEEVAQEVEEAEEPVEVTQPVVQPTKPSSRSRPRFRPTSRVTPADVAFILEKERKAEEEANEELEAEVDDSNSRQRPSFRPRLTRPRSRPVTEPTNAIEEDLSVEETVAATPAPSAFTTRQRSSFFRQRPRPIQQQVSNEVTEEENTAVDEEIETPIEEVAVEVTEPPSRASLFNSRSRFGQRPNILARPASTASAPVRPFQRTRPTTSGTTAATESTPQAEETAAPVQEQSTGTRGFTGILRRQRPNTGLFARFRGRTTTAEPDTTTIEPATTTQAPTTTVAPTTQAYVEPETFAPIRIVIDERQSSRAPSSPSLIDPFGSDPNQVATTVADFEPARVTPTRISTRGRNPVRVSPTEPSFSRSTARRTSLARGQIQDTEPTSSTASRATTRIIPSEVTNTRTSARTTTRVVPNASNRARGASRTTSRVIPTEAPASRQSVRPSGRRTTARLVPSDTTPARAPVSSTTIGILPTPAPLRTESQPSLLNSIPTVQSPFTPIPLAPVTNTRTFTTKAIEPNSVNLISNEELFNEIPKQRVAPSPRPQRRRRPGFGQRRRKPRPQQTLIAEEEEPQQVQVTPGIRQKGRRFNRPQPFTKTQASRPVSRINSARRQESTRRQEVTRPVPSQETVRTDTTRRQEVTQPIPSQETTRPVARQEVTRPVAIQEVTRPVPSQERVTRPELSFVTRPQPSPTFAPFVETSFEPRTTEAPRSITRFEPKQVTPRKKSPKKNNKKTRGRRPVANSIDLQDDFVQIAEPAAPVTRIVPTPSAFENTVRSELPNKFQATKPSKKFRKGGRVSTVDRYKYENEDGSITWGYKAGDGSFKEETIGADCITRGRSVHYPALFVI